MMQDRKNNIISDGADCKRDIRMSDILIETFKLMPLLGRFFLFHLLPQILLCLAQDQ